MAGTQDIVLRDLTWGPQNIVSTIFFNWAYRVLSRQKHVLTIVTILATILPYVWYRLDFSALPVPLIAKVTIQSTDNLYYMLSDYLNSKCPSSVESSRKALMSNRIDFSETYEQEALDRNKVRYYPISRTPQWLWFERRLLIFSYCSEYGTASSASSATEIIIRTIGRDRTTIQRFLDHVIRYWNNRFNSYTCIQRNVGSQWEIRASRPKRDLDSVILEDSIREGLKKDLAWYWDPATIGAYKKRGQPHRRGYLFYGPPGTGKTSTISGIAGMLDLNIFILTLDLGTTDNRLLELMESIPPRSIVLIEDIDRVKIGNITENGKIIKHLSLTMSGVLNAIDGVTSPLGHLLIITTNHPEQLDAALIRPGRIDRRFLFDNCDKKQLRQLFINYFRDHKDQKLNLDILDLAARFADKVPERLVSPAKVQVYLSAYSNGLDAITALDKEEEGGRFLTPETKLEIPDRSFDDTLVPVEVEPELSEHNVSLNQEGDSLA